MAKAGTYNLRLTAKYTGSHYTNVGGVDFVVTVVDPCPTATITLGTNVFSNAKYDLGVPTPIQ